jgi:DGQHR domain-containing protein
VKIEAFKLSQWGTRGNIDLYSCVFRARDLVEYVKIDRWNEKNYGGYQRVTSERRLGFNRGSIVRYLMRELGCFPSSVLLNVRGNASFTPDKTLDWYSRGILDADEKEFWIIDGQHRVEALRRAMTRNADYGDYPVITSIVRLPDRFDELLLFYIINRRQQGVSTDLAYRHLQRMLWQKGEAWILDFKGKPGLDKSYSMEIVDILNKEPISPWNGRIRYVHEPKTAEHVIADSQLASTILPLLKDDNFSGVPIKKIAVYLIDYWNALYRLFPECVNSPREYTLMRRNGVYAMHRLFKEIFTQIKDETVDEEALYLRLSRLTDETPDHEVPDFCPPLSSDFWSIQDGSTYANSSTRSGKEALFSCLYEKLWLATA